MAEQLSPADRSTLAVLLDGIIPADEHGPAAVELGVLAFLERGLAEDTQGDITLLRELATAAQDAVGADHAVEELGTTDVAVLLATLDREHPTAFELLRRRAIEGFFADPTYGGNLDEAGWRLIGYLGPKGTFTAADQEFA